MRPKVYHRKSAFFEMTKKLKIGRGGRNFPEGFWIVLGHHNRSIYHLSITKSWFFHRFWKKYRRPKGGWLFLDSLPEFFTIEIFTEVCIFRCNILDVFIFGNYFDIDCYLGRWKKLWNRCIFDIKKSWYQKEKLGNGMTLLFLWEYP